MAKSKTALIDCKPRFVGSGGEGITTADGKPVPVRTGVGLSFDCPCGRGARGYVGFSNPLDGGPAIEKHTWERTGDTLETLTLKPSIHNVIGCGWHGYLTDGQLEEC